MLWGHLINLLHLRVHHSPFGHLGGTTHPWPPCTLPHDLLFAAIMVTNPRTLRHDLPTSAINHIMTPRPNTPQPRQTKPKPQLLVEPMLPKLMVGALPLPNKPTGSAMLTMATTFPSELIPPESTYSSWTIWQASTLACPQNNYA